MEKLTHDEFMELFVRAQSRVFGFITIFLPRLNDAEEVFQCTCLVLWKKWDQYDQDRDFVAWACGIARFEVRNYLRTRQGNRVTLSDAALEKIAQEQHQLRLRRDNDFGKLEDCLEQLSRSQRELLEQCYLESAPIQAVADQLRMSRATLYKRLDRIRWALMNCIEKT